MSSATDPHRRGDRDGAGAATEDGRQAPQEPARRGVLIWDWPTRLFHWTLAACVLGSWITARGFDWLEWHMKIGYVTLGLLLFRWLWGFVGPKHARFASFVAGPRATLAYLKSLLGRDGDGSGRAGHNPLGGLAVLVMLVLLSVQAVTGLFATDELLYVGPYNGAVSSETGEALTSLHKQNVELLLVVIGVHLVAIAFYALYKRQNLVLPMITGRKRDLLDAQRSRAAIPSSRSLLALALGLLVAAAVWLLISLAPPPPAADFF
jgi:cytochrome b